MTTLNLIKNENHEYTCGDIGISADEWYALLNKTSYDTVNVLICFLREEDNCSACGLLSDKYGQAANYYNKKTVTFAQFAQKELNRFKVVSSDSSKDTFWSIPMEKGWYKGKQFIWKLRPELVEALRRFLMHKLISDYRAIHKKEAFGGQEELYKWELINKDQDADALTIVKSLKGNSVVDNARVDGVFLKLLETKPNELEQGVNALFDESIPLDNRVAKYKEDMRSVCPSDWKNRADDERTASSLLTCKYPDKYIFYKDEIYRNTCDYFGYPYHKTASKKFSHFLEFMNQMVSSYGTEIQNIMLNEIKDFEIKPESLAIQTLFWCMRERIRKEIDNTLIKPTMKQSKYNHIVKLWQERKNLVLFGAPGTGKTYDIPEYVVRLCNPSFYADDASREEIIAEYKRLKNDKRVMFTTFHQSMDYEDWIEGLRPVVDEGQVTYSEEPGIFKRLCDEATKPIITDKSTGISSDAVIWKVSLAGTGDNPVRYDCMKNNYIRIGWDDYGPEISDQTDWNIHNGTGKQILDAFINKMKEGDIVMSCYSNKTIDAIGVVVGDYEWMDHFYDYKRVRKVNWLVKGINEDVYEINGKKLLTTGTLYRLNSITLDDVKALLEKHKQPQSMEKNNQPYVMVIDELNRGNVSKIFGELITLLETDKRRGAINEESCVLPYSKSVFQISENVYIIATMNTADRSLGTLDYAIRRRFAFVPCRPYQPEGVLFDADSFAKVSSLFISN